MRHSGIFSHLAKYLQACVMTLLLSVTFELALSQTVVTLALKDLTRFYGAAVVLVANAISGVNKLDPVQIPKEDRNNAVDELDKVSFAISRLRSSQAPLVFDLSEYVNNVRSGALKGKARADEWSQLVSTMDRVSGVVKSTLDVSENSHWLKVTLDTQDRLSLREVLLSRVSLLEIGRASCRERV